MYVVFFVWFKKDIFAFSGGNGIGIDPCFAGNHVAIDTCGVYEDFGIDFFSVGNQRDEFIAYDENLMVLWKGLICVDFCSLGVYIPPWYIQENEYVHLQQGEQFRGIEWILRFPSCNTEDAAANLCRSY